MRVVTDPELLAREMLRIENGVTVDVPPTTKAGRAVQVDYRPTVGVVFYIEAEGVPRLMQDLARELAPHAGGPSRAIATSPATVVRAAGATGATVVHPTRRACFTKPDGDAPQPARLLMQTAEPELPRHYGVRAGFTWVFTAIEAVAEIERFETMTEVNAVVASVIFDPGRALPFEAGAEVGGAAGGVRDLFPLHEASRAVRAAGAFIVVADGGGLGLEFVGDCRNVRAGSGRAPDLEFAEADPDALPVCAECQAPVGGVAVGAASARRRTYMCVHCWNAEKRGGGEYSLVILPPQAAAAARVAAERNRPADAMVARLLAGAVAPLPAPGAYRVTPPDGAAVVLASDELGPHPGLTVPAVAATRLPVLGRQRVFRMTADELVCGA